MNESTNNPNKTIMKNWITPEKWREVTSHEEHEEQREGQYAIDTVTPLPLIGDSS